jgi:DNA-directed RNA polymerase specialized sigma24 family protein
MSTTDVATSLTMTPGNVAVLLHRAKVELQRCLADDEALVA